MCALVPDYKNTLKALCLQAESVDSFGLFDALCLFLHEITETLFRCFVGRALCGKIYMTSDLGSFCYLPFFPGKYKIDKSFEKTSNVHGSFVRFFPIPNRIDFDTEVGKLFSHLHLLVFSFFGETKFIKVCLWLFQ